MFVNLFDAYKKANINFRYHVKTKRISDEHFYEMNCTPQNFPLNMLHDDKFDIYYVIYREGQCLTLNSSNERLKKDLMDQT